MELRLSLRNSISLRNELRQELKTRITLQHELFGDFVITPKGQCHQCGHVMSNEEIMKGFTDDPFDFRTTCYKCGHRFLTHLIITDPKSGDDKEAMPVIYMCKIQTLHALRQVKAARGRVGIKHLANHNRQLFYNMTKYWGSYQTAMRQLT